MTETSQTQNEVQTNWLEVESANLQAPIGEKLPALKFEENKIIEIDVDFSKPFNKWTDKSIDGKKNVVKAIVPITHEGIRKNWWLNVKNPAYKKLVDFGKAKKAHLKVVRVGSFENTRYNFVE